VIIKPDPVTLCTVQAQGYDLTVYHFPSEDYNFAREPFHEIARYLGWDSWIWAFPEISDFRDDWLRYPEKMVKANLWILSVPRASIRWCALKRQRKGVTPVETWFFQDEESIRAAGDIPQGLVKTPIRLEWVLRVKRAKEVFGQYGLLRKKPP